MEDDVELPTDDVELEGLFRQAETGLWVAPRYSPTDAALIHERLEFFKGVVDEVIFEMESLPGNSKKRAENQRLLKEDQKKLCNMVEHCLRFGMPMGPEWDQIQAVESFLLGVYPDAKPSATLN